jgi:hypothetical protein
MKAMLLIQTYLQKKNWYLRDNYIFFYNRIIFFYMFALLF